MRRVSERLARYLHDFAICASSFVSIFRRAAHQRIVAATGRASFFVLTAVARALLSARDVFAARTGT